MLDLLNTKPTKNILNREFTLEVAQGLEERGNLALAAMKYLEVGLTNKAVSLYESAGQHGKAVYLADLHGDYHNAARIAITYNVDEYEFKVLPQIKDMSFIESMSLFLMNRLGVGKTATRLGFKGFYGKTVCDIGTRDGRYVDVFRKLGAKDIFGIDPDLNSLKIAVDNNILDVSHALPYFLENLPEDYYGKFEVATILNFNVNDPETFIKRLSEILPSDAQILITVAEDKALHGLMPILSQYYCVKTEKLLANIDRFDLINLEPDYPNKNLLVCSPKLKN